jgi:hypothetical protein
MHNWILTPNCYGLTPYMATNIGGNMRAYGSKRTFGKCFTTMFKRGGKIHVDEFIKNRKNGRRYEID